MVDYAKLGTEVPVNTQTLGYQAFPTVTGLSNGGFVVTWQDGGGSSDVVAEGSQTLGDDDGSSIKAQVFSALGVKVGSEFLVNTETAGNQLGPTTAALSNGGFVVTWEDGEYDDDGSHTLGDDDGSSIKAQVFSAKGEKVGSEFLVNTDPENFQYLSTVTGLSQGRFVVTWVDAIGDGGHSNIKAQIFTAKGETDGDEFTVNTAVNSESVPTITGLSGGGFVVTWSQYIAGLAGSSFSIEAQLFADDGTTMGNEFQVNTVTTNYPSDSVVAGLSNGGFAVVWQSASTGESGLRARVFSATGEPAGDEFPLIAETADGHGSSAVTGASNSDDIVTWEEGPSITSLSSGGFVVTWEHHEGEGNAASIRAQVFSNDGEKVGSEFPVNIETVGDHRDPSIAGLSGGGFVAAWDVGSAVLDDDSALNIEAQIFAQSGHLINQAPSNIALSKTTVKENVKAETVIGVLSGTDPDTGDHLTFSLVKNPDHALAIKNGRLVVASGAEIDFETHSSYKITVRATDDGGLHYDKAFTIKVVDVIDQVTGTSAANTLKGASGIDVIHGLGGKDTLYGYGGDDTLDGGKDADKLYGAAGSDTFVFVTGDSGKTHATADTIYDFTKSDRIDLTGWDADSKAKGMQDFEFIGVQAFAGHAGELHFIKEKSDTWIEGDTDGNKKADFVIHLDDAVTMKAGYFDGLV